MRENNDYSKAFIDNITKVGHRNRSTHVIKPERYVYAANCRIHGPECSLILRQHSNMLFIVIFCTSFGSQELKNYSRNNILKEYP